MIWVAVILSLLLHVPIVIFYVWMLLERQPNGWDDSPILVEYYPFDEPEELPEEEEQARIYINPEILHREGEREVEEGCLSIPGWKAFITRSIWIKFRALDQESRTVKLRADSLLAQALEHEVDHLNGILYIDHLQSHQELIPVTPESESEDAEALDGPAETGVEPRESSASLTAG